MEPERLAEVRETRANGDWVFVRKRGLLDLRGHAALWPLVEPAYAVWKAGDSPEAA
jgi:hypothetical protein